MTKKKTKTVSSMTVEEIVSELNEFTRQANLYGTAAYKSRTQKEQERYEALHREYPKKVKTHREKQKQKYNKAAKKATGLSEGTRVEYSFDSPFGFAEFLTGIVVKYRGKLQVRLDEKFSNKRYTPIHKGWKRTKK